MSLEPQKQPWKPQFGVAINSLRPMKTGIDMEAIIVDYLGCSNDVHNFIIADQSGSINLCLWGNEGKSFIPMQTVRITGAYTKLYQKRISLYMKKDVGRIVRIGEFRMLFSLKPNVSGIDWIPDPERSWDQKAFIVEDPSLSEGLATISPLSSAPSTPPPLDDNAPPHTRNASRKQHQQKQKNQPKQQHQHTFSKQPQQRSAGYPLQTVIANQLPPMVPAPTGMNNDLQMKISSLISLISQMPNPHPELVTFRNTLFNLIQQQQSNINPIISQDISNMITHLTSTLINSNPTPVNSPDMNYQQPQQPSTNSRKRPRRNANLDRYQEDDEIPAGSLSDA